MPPGQPPYEEDRMGRRRIFAGGGGRGPRGNPGGLLGDAIGFRWLRFFLPDDDGGACAVRWFDIGADFVYFVRDNRAPDRVVSEFGFNQGLPALSLQDIDFNESAGFRFYANIQLGSASSLATLPTSPSAKVSRTLILRRCISWFIPRNSIASNSITAIVGSPPNAGIKVPGWLVPGT
jgi:hypothetical protein